MFPIDELNLPAVATGGRFDYPLAALHDNALQVLEIGTCVSLRHVLEPAMLAVQIHQCIYRSDESPLVELPQYLHPIEERDLPAEAEQPDEFEAIRPGLIDRDLIVLDAHGLV